MTDVKVEKQDKAPVVPSAQETEEPFSLPESLRNFSDEHLEATRISFPALPDRTSIWPVEPIQFKPTPNELAHLLLESADKKSFERLVDLGYQVLPELRSVMINPLTDYEQMKKAVLAIDGISDSIACAELLMIAASDRFSKESRVFAAGFARSRSNESDRERLAEFIANPKIDPEIRAEALPTYREDWPSLVKNLPAQDRNSLALTLLKDPSILDSSFLISIRKSELFGGEVKARAKEIAEARQVRISPGAHDLYTEAAEIVASTYEQPGLSPAGRSAKLIELFENGGANPGALLNDNAQVLMHKQFDSKALVGWLSDKIVSGKINPNRFPEFLAVYAKHNGSINELESILENPRLDPISTIEIINGYGKLDDPKVTQILIAKNEQCETDRSDTSLISKLLAVGSTDGHRYLAEKLSKNQIDPSYLAADVVEALSKVNTGEFNSAFYSVLKSDFYVVSVKNAATLALYKAQDSDLEDVLRTHLDSPYEGLKFYSAFTLSRLKPTDTASREILRSYYNHPEFSDDAESASIMAFYNSRKSGDFDTLLLGLSAPGGMFRRVLTKEFSAAGEVNQFCTRLDRAADKRVGLIDLLNLKINDVTAWMHSYRHFLLEAQKLGIERPFRFTPELLSEIVVNRTTDPNLDTRPRVLVVYPKSDWNGAFCNFNEPLSQLTKGYRIEAYEAGTDEEVVAILSKYKDLPEEKKLAGVILAGHGSKEQVSLGDEDPGKEEIANSPQTLDLEDKAKFIQSGAGNALARGGFVVGLSCSIGQGEDLPGQDQNIVNLYRGIFERAAPKMIFGPVQPSRELFFDLDVNNRVKEVRYNVPAYRAEIDQKNSSEYLV